jgi:hypothetical protein
MRTAVLLLTLATAGVSLAAKSSDTKAGAAADTIQMHLGVPGVVFVGQPLAEFLAKFPAASKSPVVGQTEALRLQVEKEGISCLALGATPASMTIESIGFNFGPPYEGVQPGRRRTREGIGTGSTVNDLLGLYGRPAQTSAEPVPGAPRNKRRVEDPAAPTRHLYRSDDGSTTSYFVVQGADVLRMVIARPAEIAKHLSKKPGEDARPPSQDGDGASAPPPPPAAAPGSPGGL